jgi:hypothetical protein
MFDFHEKDRITGNYLLDIEEFCKLINNSTFSAKILYLIILYYII